MTRRVLMIAGGGTGGHLFPGLAVAEQWLALDPEHEAVFVGTAQGIEARRVPEAGHEFFPIRSRGIAGKGFAGKIKGLLTLPLSMLDAIRVTRKISPDVALGVGGFVSGPAILAARLLGTPAAIQEQNAAPGFANRILARLVREIYISFEPARPWFGSADRKGKVILTGNPVRGKIVEAIETALGPGGPRQRKPGKNILVVGGSQGAHALNMLVPQALGFLDEQRRGELKVVHQSGAADLDLVTASYREIGVVAEVKVFIEDMAKAYAEAGLVISRAGAGAVAEIALAGLPAIFIPYPYAASDHQAVNASALVEQGAAMMAREKDADPESLLNMSLEILDDPGRARSMSESARQMARPRAARDIADRLLAMSAGQDGEATGQEN